MVLPSVVDPVLISVVDQPDRQLRPFAMLNRELRCRPLETETTTALGWPAPRPGLAPTGVWPRSAGTTIPAAPEEDSRTATCRAAWVPARRSKAVTPIGALIAALKTRCRRWVSCSSVLDAPTSAGHAQRAFRFLEITAELADQAVERLGRHRARRRLRLGFETWNDFTAVIVPLMY